MGRPRTWFLKRKVKPKRFKVDNYWLATSDAKSIGGQDLEEAFIKLANEAEQARREDEARLAEDWQRLFGQPAPWR